MEYKYLKYKNKYYNLIGGVIDTTDKDSLEKNIDSLRKKITLQNEQISKETDVDKKSKLNEELQIYEQELNEQELKIIGSLR